MIRKIGLTAALAGLTVFAASCSPLSGAAPALQSRTFQSSALSGGAVTFSIFSDLPKNPPGYPEAITAGPDGALWVADDMDQDFAASVIARIDVKGRRTATFRYGTNVLPSFSDITHGPDGALWIADAGDRWILRMTTAGHFTRYSFGANSPLHITPGPDGALWFTELLRNGSAIGRITTSGQTKHFTAGISPGAAVADITPGPDGALWFTEYGGDRIGRITTSGSITEFSKGITAGAHPLSIRAARDGALWFTEYGTGAIGRITTGGAVTEYTKGISPGEHPIDLVAATADIWFTESQDIQTGQRSKIAKISPSGTITEYPDLTAGADPVCLVKGPDGNLWFVEQLLNSVGRVNI